MSVGEELQIMRRELELQIREQREAMEKQLREAQEKITNEIKVERERVSGILLQRNLALAACIICLIVAGFAVNYAVTSRKALDDQVNTNQVVLCAQGRSTALAFRKPQISADGKPESKEHFLNRMIAQRETLLSVAGLNCSTQPGFDTFPYLRGKALTEIDNILQRLAPRRFRQLQREEKNSPTPPESAPPSSAPSSGTSSPATSGSGAPSGGSGGSGGEAGGGGDADQPKESQPKAPSGGSNPPASEPAAEAPKTNPPPESGDGGNDEGGQDEGGGGDEGGEGGQGSGLLNPPLDGVEELVEGVRGKACEVLGPQACTPKQ